MQNIKLLTSTLQRNQSTWTSFQPQERHLKMPQSSLPRMDLRSSNVKQSFRCIHKPYLKMPLYIVSHYTPLSTSEKDALAWAITKSHTELFTTPSIFVNVKFQDIKDTSCYVGGYAVCVPFLKATIDFMHILIYQGVTNPNLETNKQHHRTRATRAFKAALCIRHIMQHSCEHLGRDCGRREAGYGVHYGGYCSGL